MVISKNIISKLSAKQAIDHLLIRDLNFGLTKRQKIILASILTTLGFMIASQTVNVVFRRYYFIIALGIFSYILTLWSLWEGMTKLKAGVLLILPTIYCVSLTSFYYLFTLENIRWLTRLPMAVIFGLSFYTLLLTQNVFNVASNRAIPLYRAAISGSFVYTILTFFLMFSVILSMNLPFYWNGVVVLLATLPIFIQLLWTIRIEDLDNQTIIYSLIMAVIAGESSLALSFWNSAPVFKALLLVLIIYALMGLIVDFMRERLNKEAGIWYLVIALSLFILVSLVSFAV